MNDIFFFDKKPQQHWRQRKHLHPNSEIHNYLCIHVRIRTKSKGILNSDTCTTQSQAKGILKYMYTYMYLHFGHHNYTLIISALLPFHWSSDFSDIQKSNLPINIMAIGRVIDTPTSTVTNTTTRTAGNMELWELNGSLEMVGNDFLKFLFVIIHASLRNQFENTL